MLEVGRLGRAHGVRGDLYLDLLTDRTERLAVGARLKAGERWLVVQRAKPAGTRWLVHFEGIDDRTVADTLVGTTLLAEPLPEGSTPADPDALYVHELIGAEVVDLAGVSHGRCTSILANPANDLLELENGALVPVVFVVSLDVTADGGRRVVIDPPEGLFELFES